MAPPRTNFTCIIGGCDKQAMSHGLCSKHNARLKRNGSPLKTHRAGYYLTPEQQEKEVERLLPVRLWDSVDVRGSDECWEWQQHRQKDGYGRFEIYNKPFLAHRAAWVVTFGPIPDNLLVCHHCDNPPCCNPDHLFLGTAEDNMADMVAKGRARNHPMPGEMSPRAKLTEQQVREIRASNLPGNVLANLYGISESHTANLRNGQFWKHLH